MPGSIGSAAREGDYSEVLKRTLVKVADITDETTDGRNISALAIKIADLIERIEARDGEAPIKKTAEVTPFEVIAGRRGEHREAAEG